MTHEQPAGFLALPTAGVGQPVLVLHPWWGLNETIRAFCTRLAEAGFAAFAPDLYHDQLADTIEGAEKLAKALGARQEAAKAEIIAAAQFLNERVGAAEGALTVIGFSLGASYALDVAGSNPELFRAVVIFYGTGGEDFSRSRAAYLGHFAENDPYEAPEYVDQLEATLKQAGRPVTFYRYPGVGHWFFEPDRTDAYNPAAASLAWQRTLAFLQAAHEQPA